MPKKNVRCPGGHQILVEIKEGYAAARAVSQDSNTEGSAGHSQACPICNRKLFIKYLP